MKKKFYLATCIFIFIAASVSLFTEPPYVSENSRTVETENYKILLTSEYPTAGAIERKQTVNGKREMVINIADSADNKKTCEVLYNAAKTNYGSPCAMVFE
ncbi:MAG: hypothetical protein ABEI13_01725 [Candidatus Paceibacteria bacterium]